MATCSGPSRKFAAIYSERRSATVKSYETAFGKAGDLSPEEKSALYKKMVTDKLEADEQYQTAYNRLTECNTKLKPYKAPLNRTGHLYTQK